MSKKSKLVQLSPYFDEGAIVRVGGCIDRAAIINMPFKTFYLESITWLTYYWLNLFMIRLALGQSTSLRSSEKCTG